jgi:hypothetical protein
MTRLLSATVILTALSSSLFAVIPDPIRTDAGELSGVTLASRVRVFKGIPFAAPPLGDLRWRPAQPAPKWTGVRKADRFGHVCPQPKGRGRLNVSVDLPDSPPASEDCLYLNVWTAAASSSERRPVMVWIFGGASARRLAFVLRLRERVRPQGVQPRASTPASGSTICSSENGMANG